MTSKAIFTYTDGSALYTVSAKWLATLDVWEGNRVLDEAHVEDLTRSIKSPQDIQGPFSVVEYPDDDGRPQRKIIDGQHRQTVLKRAFETATPPADFTVLARRYQIADHAAAIRIFQQINHAKPMEYKGSPTERLHEFVEATRKHFISDRGKSDPRLIRPSTTRPFLSISDLEAAIKRYAIHERAELTPKQFVEHAEGMNEFYAEDLTRIPSGFTAASLNKAAELGFYLGLDPKCTWLLGLKKAASS
jgi:hypothetical protein